MHPTALPLSHAAANTGGAAAPLPPFVHAVADAMWAKKATDVTILDLRGLDTRPADFFVLATGQSPTQTGAIADSILNAAREHGEQRVSLEGKQTGQWVLIDYVDVVCHVMVADQRQYYGIEDMWGDARIYRPADPNAGPNHQA